MILNDAVHVQMIINGEVQCVTAISKVLWSQKREIIYGAFTVLELNVVTHLYFSVAILSFK